jgi:peroxiredoxin
MARTPSTMIPLGTKAPDFKLPDTVSGKLITLSEQKGKVATVVMFICNHCPFVKHVNPELIRLSRDYAGKGVGFVAISSNDAIQYPEDAPDQMKKNAQTLGYSFPYLYDETQDTARAYQAACTPDFYIFNKDLTLVYRGQLDDSRPGNGLPLTGKDIRNALDNLLNNRQISAEQRPSIGCNIKWKY